MNKKYAIAIMMLTGLAACGGAEAANTPASTSASTPAAKSAQAPGPTGPTTGAYGQNSGGYTATPTASTTVPTTAAPTTAPTTAAPTSTTAPAAATPAVAVVDSMLGRILAGPNGNTMYGFTKDADGTPTCDGSCAKAWPPVIVDASVDLSRLPNSQLFSIVDRPDGSKQLKVGKWPLYYFSGDAAPGDTNGQGSGGSWFVVGQNAKLIK